MQERFPEGIPELFDGIGSIDMVIDTPQTRARHLELIPFYLADTSVDRDPLALPADTPLLEVVRTFTARWDAGDIEGYEALFNPLSGYPSGQDAPVSWFTAVTGTSTDRQCELVEETLVRCIEVMSPGLLPGTRLDPVVTEWAGAAGWIWRIDFPDGPPAAFATPGDAPGVKEYRDWVRDNDPDAFDTLFPDGIQMRLNTQEVRDAHTAMVARYLAAITGG